MGGWPLSESPISAKMRVPPASRTWGSGDGLGGMLVPSLSSHLVTPVTDDKLHTVPRTPKLGTGTICCIGHHSIPPEAGTQSIWPSPSMETVRRFRESTPSPPSCMTLCIYTAGYKVNHKRVESRRIPSPHRDVTHFVYTSCIYDESLKLAPLAQPLETAGATPATPTESAAPR
jgi:hypothetical protein